MFQWEFINFNKYSWMEAVDKKTVASDRASFRHQLRWIKEISLYVSSLYQKRKKNCWTNCQTKLLRPYCSGKDVKCKATRQKR